MRPAENIEKLIEKLHDTTSTEMDQRVLKDVLHTLAESQKTTTPTRRTIMKSPIIKLAAAAVIILGLFFLSRYLISDVIPRYTERTYTATADQDENQSLTTPPQTPLEAELEMAKLLFGRQDLAGLLQLLQTGQELTKMRVAEYLGQIGDGSVLSALQIFAEQWQGSEQDNPFQKAIRAIQERQVEPEHQVTTGSKEPNELQAPPEENQTGVAGIVIDKNTYQPIQGAEVGFRSTETVITDAEGQFTLIYADSYEETHVYVRASGYASRVIGVHMKKGIIQNVTIELSPSSKLTGVVIDTNGQPIQGANVRIAGHHIYSGLPILTTDTNGRFEVDGLDPAVGASVVLVSHPAYPAVSDTFKLAPAGQTQHIEIVLKPGVVVFGQVTNSQGVPISGVTVGNTRSGAMWNCLKAKTDEEGMYRLGIVKVGELVLWATHDRYAPFVTTAVLAGEQAEYCINIQLEDARTLYGCVIDTDGDPIPGAIVTISDYNGVRNLDEQRHQCDSDGRFSIPNAPSDGELELRIFGKGITGQDYKVDLSQDECLITVSRSGKIYGEVVDATTGEPIPRFRVKMTFSRVGPRTSGYAATWSDEGYTFDSSKGFFDTGREDLPVNGQYRMTVYAEGFDPITVDPVVVQPACEDPNRTLFILQPATIFAGRVIARDGQPVKGATILFFSNGNVQERESWLWTVTDKAGIFTISGLGSEPQCLSVSAADFTPRVYLMTDLIKTPGLLADIVLDRAANLFGRVVDENNKGIMNARVHAFVDLGRARNMLTRFPSLGPSVRTDKDGYYKLSGVPTGQVQISVMSAKNFEIGHKKIDLKPGDSMELNFGD